MRRLTLWPEIGLLVIDHLGSEELWDIHIWDAYHLRALARCARACKDWLHRSRVNLYRTIYVTDRDSIRSLRHAFAVNPSLSALVESVKWNYARHLYPKGCPELYEVVLFIREAQIHHFQSLTLSEDLDCRNLISFNNPVRAALYAAPYSSLHTLSISSLSTDHVFFLLRAFTSLRNLRCRSIMKGHKNSIHPRRLSLSSFEVNTVALIHVCLC